MSIPDLNLLVTLDVLLAEGSVARAAERLQLSPSAMSRALARLRDATGDPLLVRAGRGLVPTPRALELRDRVSHLVRDAEVVLRPAERLNLRTLVRTFTLRTREGFVENFGPALLARIAKEAPGIRLSFVGKPNKESTSLRDGSVDLDTGVIGSATSPEVRTRALFRDRFVGVVRKGHMLSKGKMTPSRYASGAHISVSRRGAGKGPIDETLKPFGLERRIDTIVGGFSAALALARASDLIATVPERQTGILRNGMHSFHLPFPAPEFTVSLLWHPRLDADAAHRWLRGVVLETCADVRTGGARLRRVAVSATTVLALILPGIATLHAQAPAPFDRVILGGTVMDPASGLNAIRNVGLRGGRIAAISTQAMRARDTVQATGLIVAPGFIDVHAHGQTAETYRFQALDGVTSSFELELGTAEVAEWYRERGAGQRINYGVSVGHIKVRMAVLHDSGKVMPVGPAAYRAATPGEIREIAQRIRRGLDAGALSVGAGFTYTPAATHEELLTVFRVAAAAKTPVHVHIRSGVAGLTEALGLAKESGAALHVVHINSAGLDETPAMLKMISEAKASGMDVSTEAYPYTAGMTEIQSATVQDTYRSAPDSQLADIEWPRTGERLNRASFDTYSRMGGPVVIHRNTDAMVAAAITSPLTMIGSDAYWQDGTGHPRTTGTFSRVLGRYAREAHAITLMDALRKMTLMPAQRLEARVPVMRRKGRLAVGADADITIFDASTVLDRSTYREPSLPPVGMQHVIVNGVSVVANGHAVEGVTPGRAVRAAVRPR